MKRSIVLVFLTAASLLPAQELRLLSHEVREPYHTYILAAPGELTITLISQGALTERQEQWLTNLYQEGLTFSTLQARDIRVLVQGSAAEINIQPAVYRRAGYDLTPFIPSGIQLYYEDLLEYDFRVLIGHYFLRLRGDYTGDVALATTILSAAENPADYLDAQTTRRLDQRFGEIKSEVAALKAEDTQQTKTLSKIEQDLYEVQQSNALISDAVEVNRADITEVQASVAAVQSVVSTLQNELATNRTDIAELLAFQESLTLELAGDQTGSALEGISRQYTTLSTDLKTLRSALLALNNRRGRPLNQAAVDRVVELKTANPGLTSSQVASQIKDEGLQLSNRELSLVFSVYFNEF